MQTVTIKGQLYHVMPEIKQCKLCAFNPEFKASRYRESCFASEGTDIDCVDDKAIFVKPRWLRTVQIVAVARKLEQA